MNTFAARLTAAVSAALIIVLASAGIPANAATTPPACVQVCEVQPMSQAIYGDSITSWVKPYKGDPNQSWVHWGSSETYPASFGWASPGATLAAMAAQAVDSDAKIVQIMAGTNDLPIAKLKKVGTPKAEMFASIDHIVATESPEIVVLLAVAPFGFDYQQSIIWNEELRQYAAAKGWHYFDPWSGLRDSSGAWLPGTTIDTIHPSPLWTWKVGREIHSNLQSIIRGIQGAQPGTFSTGIDTAN